MIDANWSPTEHPLTPFRQGVAGLCGRSLDAGPQSNARGSPTWRRNKKRTETLSRRWVQLGAGVQLASPAVRHADSVRGTGGCANDDRPTWPPREKPAGSEAIAGAGRCHLPRADRVPPGRFKPAEGKGMEVPATT
jgi:hypothetical protein